MTRITQALTAAALVTATAIPAFAGNLSPAEQTVERCFAALRPIVENWTPPYVSEQQKERMLADLGLYVGCYSPAQLEPAGYRSRYPNISLTIHQD